MIYLANDRSQRGVISGNLILEVAEMTAEDNEWIRSVTLDVSLIYGCGCDAADKLIRDYF